MKIDFFKFIYCFLFCNLLISCSDDDDGVFCTQEFRTITIKVNGPDLDDFFTVRQQTGDTIRINKQNVPYLKEYPVLDDRFRALIEGRTENFRFTGIIDDTVAVSEIFVIRADQCHIEFISGNREVNL